LQNPQSATEFEQKRALALSTLAFTVCFAVWTIFSIIGIKIKQDLGLSETQFGLLVATPILSGSISRIFLGIWTEQIGGRIVLPVQMLVTAVSVWLLASAQTYIMFLLAALGLGLSGGSFSIGVAYVSQWFPQSKQGTALGFFGVGNVGAAITSFAAPFLVASLGWQGTTRVYAVVLAVTAVAIYLGAKTDPTTAARRNGTSKAPSFMQQLEPLRKLQVWRFSLYYFFVFGGFVSLALWLPHYLSDVYGVGLKTAGILAAAFSLPASIFRAYGGVLSDRFGARKAMYWSFGFSLVALFMLSYPSTEYIVNGVRGPIHFAISMGLVPFVFTTFALGFFMSLGSAAVYKHIPVYYPGNVGAVGGLVGMIGGLGGFVMPIIFGVLLDLTNVYTSSFALLFLIVAGSLIWMHMSIRAMEHAVMGQALRDLPAFPELQEAHAALADKPNHVLEEWTPEDAGFWAEKGRKTAQRNLWVSIPSLLLAFSVWLVWSVVVAKLPAIGFNYSVGQLFWLAALPGLSGATLRIFYSFMVPIFGGRLWTTLSTGSLLIPALGMGYAVQDPTTPYLIFIVLALLCGFGGGNFASSMANISFFYPKSEKGQALALNAGLGNLGVSVMQFLVPLVITVGVFGAIGGEPQALSDGTKLWVQNAGFIWVPFLILSTVAAWVWMDDIADSKASFKEQAIIFKRLHNWVMSVLYTGTFGSFIGYAAGFPLLIKLEFPEVSALHYAFLGPLVGALSRAGTGWISDRFGGGRVTFWTFVGMMVSVYGVNFFLPSGGLGGNFWGFFASFMALFFLTGVGNASTFQMIPTIMRAEIPRLMPELDATATLRQAERESAAIIAFTSAIAAYGAFFIPKAYGSSIAITGAPNGALWAFFAFYAVCALVTWAFYTRKSAPLPC